MAQGKEQAETVTCRHCRYERPAGDARCHICGYPWPWLKAEDKAVPPKKPGRSGAKGE
jgi:hypothetical protein